MAKNKKSKKLKKAIGVKFLFLSLFVLLIMLIFTPTTIILVIGMLPTLVSYIVDNSVEKNKTFTIGAMNFAGCFPFLLEIWTGENTIDVALMYLSKPETIIFMYCVAGVGYMINWIVTILVANVLKQKSLQRIKQIDKEQQELIDRWGRTVNGEYELNADGFPKHQTFDP